MRRRIGLVFILALAVCASACALIGAGAPARDLRLPSIFGDHMVLQREAPIPVWGWASPRQKVTVALAGKSVTTRANANGDWVVRLPAMQAGGPFALEVAADKTVRFSDVLIGEVWVCSGQSNMQMGLKQVDNAEKEVAEAHYPKMRLIQFPQATAARPRDDINATWAVCTPENVARSGGGSFSAVAYFFGREIHKGIGVPVGLINTSWGGTRIEPWTPREGFAMTPELAKIQEQVEKADAQNTDDMEKALPEIADWAAEARASLDAGEPISGAPTWPGGSLDNRAAPTGLYNAMVAPHVPFAIRGTIWYQGEANRADGMEYFYKMKALIGGWRSVWNQGDFPFYFVQIAPFQYGEADPLELARLWEAQTASLGIANTGIAGTTDIGNTKDVHPRNKQDVGKRLALWALAKTYGRDTVHSGPLYKSMAVEGGTVRLRFDHAQGGLASRDGKALSWFQIAGEDKKFERAKAEIDGETLLVSSPKVAAPVAVRFGYHKLAEPNLVNKAGLPALPFRTDDW